MIFSSLSERCQREWKNEPVTFQADFFSQPPHNSAFEDLSTMDRLGLGCCWAQERLPLGLCRARVGVAIINPSAIDGFTERDGVFRPFEQQSISRASSFFARMNRRQASRELLLRHSSKSRIPV